MGAEAGTIFNSFTYAEGESDENYQNYEHVIGKFNNHFVPKVNNIHDRAKFNSCCQQQSENVEAYIRAPYDIANNCNFPTAIKDGMIQDRLSGF